MMKKKTVKTDAMESYRVLLAEDDKEMRRFLGQALRKSGYEVVECPDGMAMLTHLADFLLPEELGPETFDLIISDIRMPGISGMEVLEGKPKQRDFPPMILITAFGDAETYARAMTFGAAAMFYKPFDIDDLLGTVKSILS